MQLATAVRKVLEAIQNPPNSPLFTFGIVALQACKSVLHRYPKVCLIITNNESFAKFPAELHEYILAGCTGDLPGNIDAHQSMRIHNERHTPALQAMQAENVPQLPQTSVMRLPQVPIGPGVSLF